MIGRGWIIRLSATGIPVVDKRFSQRFRACSLGRRAILTYNATSTVWIRFPKDSISAIVAEDFRTTSVLSFDLLSQCRHLLL